MPKGNSCCCGTKIYRSALGREAVGECRDICTSPVCGEPRLLTLLAPVVYDEVGLNLCKRIDLSALNLDDYPTASQLILEVADIDLNLDGGSSVETLYDRPFCIRIKLTRIRVLFYAKILDGCGHLLDTRSFAAEYLDSPYGNDDETNPSEITVDLYAPYGFACAELLGEENGEYPMTPTMYFLGLTPNSNIIRQGVVVQGLARATNFDPTGEAASIGLTLYFKTVYNVQYKVPHAGLAVPPKVEPEEPEIGACISFVEGGLLERNIMPLDLGGGCHDDRPNALDAPLNVPMVHPGHCRENCCDEE